MISRSIRLQLTLANVTLALVSIVAIGALGVLLQRQTYLDNLRERMSVETELVADDLLEALERVFHCPLPSRLARITGARLTVITMNGQVLADSAGQPDLMEITRRDRRSSRPWPASVARPSAPARRPASLAIMSLCRSAMAAARWACTPAVALTEIDRALRQTLIVVAGLTVLCAPAWRRSSVVVTQLSVPLPRP
jgi:hypothetical protein